MEEERKKEREKEKKMPFIVATYVYARSQGQRTHSARTKIRLIRTKYNDVSVLCIFVYVFLIMTSSKEISL